MKHVTPKHRSAPAKALQSKKYRQRIIPDKRVVAAINAVADDLNQFLEESRQQAALDLIDRAVEEV